jgi:hypothetical protein
MAVSEAVDSPPPSQVYSVPELFGSVIHHFRHRESIERAQTSATSHPAEPHGGIFPCTLKFKKKTELITDKVVNVIMHVLYADQIKKGVVHIFFFF